MKNKGEKDGEDRATSAKKAKVAEEKADVPRTPGKKAKLNAKSQKPPYDKVKNMKNAKKANFQEKPADWKAFKKEKKELREKRRASANKSLMDVITKAKQIGEKIRMKKLQGGLPERTKLINELHQLMGNQGNYVKFILTHDMARIVQYMLKYGSVKMREDISTEIIPSILTMMQSKYGRFVFKRLMKYGNNDIRSKCIKSFYGNAVKLTSHAVSAPVFEFAYANYASSSDRIALIQEFFGDMYKHHKDVNVKHLRDVYKNSKEMKAAALSATKANLSRILNKDLLDSGLVHSVIAQFFSECSNDDRSEMISELAPHVVVLSNSKDGARAAMNCFWYGTNKERKIAMKAIKEHIIEMCKHEHAHAAIVCLLDSADDTVLMNKTILSEIVKKTEELIADDWGRRVLTWIVSPADRMAFHPAFIKEMEDGRNASTCKKEVHVRRKEILDYCIKPLVEKIAEEPKTWCSDIKRLLLTAVVLKCGESARPAFDGVAKLLVDPDWQIDGNILIESNGGNMIIKKLIQNDKSITGGNNTFGKAIVDVLNDDVIVSWMKKNRGCFLLADIYSNNNESTQGQLKSVLKPHMKLLKSQTTKGAQILSEKLS